MPSFTCTVPCFVNGVTFQPFRDAPSNIAIQSS